MSAGTATKRKRPRRTYTAASLANAAGTLGKIEHGCEIVALTKGQFSLSDVILHVLDATGPASVDIATWSAAHAAIGEAKGLILDGRITSMRWIIDRSFPSRQPEYCRSLVDTFGRDAIRVTRTHAKFVIIRNDHWQVVIRTSANLNRNPRCEYMEISDHAELADWFTSFVDGVFAEHSPAELGGPTARIDAAFARLPLPGGDKGGSGAEPDDVFASIGAAFDSIGDNLRRAELNASDRD